VLLEFFSMQRGMRAIGNIGGRETRDAMRALETRFLAGENVSGVAKLEVVEENQYFYCGSE
jgi:hypothetical protein